MSSPNFVNLIEKKKQKKQLSRAEIEYWVKGLTRGEIPDYQTSALLMAIRLNGMDFDETLALTNAMVDSGSRLRFEGFPVLADKHSTGGIGDKVTLILAPILAACGLQVTMLSGRGLGFTGGTIDKFESLDGTSCQHDNEGMQLMLSRFGWANAQASKDIVPADRILYGLRDVTATVDSIPLITASILSKKIAGGATHLCLDVKCGSGAFMPDLPSANALAENLKKIGGMGGLEVGGLITRMEEPLGRAIGNYLELLEAVLYLKQETPGVLMEIVYALGAKMLTQTGRAISGEAARERMSKVLQSGEALDRLVAYLRFTGGREQAIERLLKAEFSDIPRVAVHALSDGYVGTIRGRSLGELMVDLGAGRKKTDDHLDRLAGLVLEKTAGDRVARGDVLAWAYGNRARAGIAGIEKYINECYGFQTEEVVLPSPILHSF